MVQMQKMEAGRRQLVMGYGESGFRVSGAHYDKAVLIRPDRTVSLAIESLDALNPDDLKMLVEADPKTELLLVGWGKAPQWLPEPLAMGLQFANIGVETMDTGAAARTYNILMMEDRQVAALLMPVG